MQFSVASSQFSVELAEPQRLRTGKEN